MKVSNIKCKLRHYLSTMVLCGSYVFEFSVGKDMGKKTLWKENSSIFSSMFSNIICQRIEN
jgi:hypothetical protein